MHKPNRPHGMFLQAPLRMLRKKLGRPVFWPSATEYWNMEGSLCGQSTFYASWSLAYHRKKLHGQSGLGDTGTTSKIPREDYRIPCRDCEEVLPNKTALYKHRKKEHSDMSLQMNVGPGTSWCDSCNRQRTSKCGDHHQKNLGLAALPRANAALGVFSTQTMDKHPNP
ncbi:hypothetical protein evm_014683 [Chilo suppressalis]|nr:hypothetical protein evm_014683 [Chilo suppressalis]